MENNLQSISKIFTERLLRIPDYQRGYAWGTKEVLDYWSDLAQVEQNKSHYVGVLTLEDVPSETVDKWSEDHWVIKKRGYSPFYVVDGQQRLTTTIVLIQSIIEVYQEKQPDEADILLNFTPIKEIKDKFIFISKDKGATRSYIFGYEKDNPSYEFLKTRIFLEKSANHGPIEETIYTSNLENAKNIFLDKLRELDCETIENVYSKVTQHFLFNIYSLDKEIDTYVAFETMNNRGKPLSHLELLKNRLIYLTTKLKEEQYEKDDLRHSINECWKSIYHYLGKSKDNPLDDDEFLYSHFTLYFDNQIDSFDFNYRSPRQLRKEYKTLLLDDIFSQKSLSDDSDVQINIDYINKYVSNLKDSVEHWYDIFNPSDNKLGCDVSKTLNKIHKIRRWVDAAPLILSVFRITSSSDERLRFLQVLERGLYIENYIYSRYSLFTKSDFVKLAKDINLHKTTPENLISSITTKVDESLKQQRQIWTKEFSKSSDFYNWMGIRYTLYEYEMSLLKKYKSDRTKLTWTDESATEPWTEYVSVEHIYPQHPKHAYWIDRFNHLSAPIRKKLRHCIGNLVPLSKSKNSSLSNKPFHHKASEGYAFGCYSENEVAKCDDWTPAQIIERTITLVKFMDQRWKLGIGNSTDAYLEFAGLKDISI